MVIRALLASSRWHLPEDTPRTRPGDRVRTAHGASVTADSCRKCVRETEIPERRGTADPLLTDPRSSVEKGLVRPAGERHSLPVPELLGKSEVEYVSRCGGHSSADILSVSETRQRELIDLVESA